MFIHSFNAGDSVIFHQMALTIKILHTRSNSIQHTAGGCDADGLKNVSLPGNLD